MTLAPSLNPLARSRRHLAALLLALACAPAAFADQITIDSRDFQPYDGRTIYQESGAGNLTCSAGNGGINLFLAQVPLPPVDLTLKQIAFWGGDVGAPDATIRLLRFCQVEFSPSTPVQTTLGTANSTGNGGNYYAMQSLDTLVDDQNTCMYMLQLSLGTEVDCGGGNLSFARARVRYEVVPQPVIDAVFKNGFEN